MAKVYKPRTKMPALITYIIAVVFLIAGLTLPIGTGTFTGGGVNFGNMPLMQLTGALAALGMIKTLPFGSPLSPAFSFTVNMSGIALDVGAILLWLYALVTLVCVIILVPLCITKKTNGAVRKVAAVLEDIAVTTLILLCSVSFAAPVAEWNLTVFAALAITVVMLIVTGIIYLRGPAILKTCTFLLSAVAVCFAVANPYNNIPAFGNAIGNLAAAMQGGHPFETSAGLYSLNGTVYFGSTLFKTALIDPSALSYNISSAILNYSALSLAALVLLNLLLNLFGINKRTNMFMVVCNLIRYILALVLLIVIYITVLTTTGSYGLGLYLLTLLALAQFTIALIRFLRHRKAAKLIKLAEEHDEDADHPDTDDEYAFEDETKPVDPPKPPQDAPQAPVVETKNVVYTVNTIYNGPSDSFIRKLTNEEKVEFARVFLERSVGNLTMIPDYVVGGDNSAFFSSLFIYLPHVRSTVTEGLMAKFYEEISKSA